MPRKPSLEGPKWSFYIERDAVYKHQYVKASISKWDPQKKQPRTAARVHVGRLCDDNSVRASKTFLEKFPEFQGKTVYYFENRLLDRDAYIEANPKALELFEELREQDEAPKKVDEQLLEEDWRAISRQCGPTYAAWTHLQQSGMADDLEAAFGKEDARLLGALAVYALCEPGAAMENFSSWLGGVYLGNVTPVSGQRISELLDRVTSAKTDLFFTKRFDRLLKIARTDRQKRAEQDPNALQEPLTVAFDSTSISTYSTTIEHAEYGKAKSNPELKRINLALVCDQASGEVLFAREYPGSINDVASFSSLFNDMKQIGFHVEDVEIVTDRGYKSSFNIQAMIDAGVRFVQGLRIDEECIKKKFVKHKDALRGNANYLSDWGYATVTLSKDEDEVWKKRTESGSVDVRLKTHLYFSDDLALQAKKALLLKVDEIIKAKNARRSVSAEDWSRFRNCVCNIARDPNKVQFVRNMEEINERLEFAGCFAIRTDYRVDPVDALSVYRRRAKVETQYRIFKNAVAGDRTRATQCAYAGKLFIFTLATSLRSRMGSTARRIAEKTATKVPNNSLSTVLMELAKVTLHRRTNSLCWRPDMITKKQRDYFALLGVLPPRGLFRN